MGMIKAITIAALSTVLALVAACGESATEEGSSGADAVTEPMSADAEAVILETANLMLSEPDFAAACENITEDRRPDACAEDVRAMVQEHLMDEGLPFDEEDIPGPQEGMSECLLHYGDGTMPLFGEVTMIFTEDGWVIDTIGNLVMEGSGASPSDYKCPEA